jgi:hypothetical protein
VSQGELPVEHVAEVNVSLKICAMLKNVLNNEEDSGNGFIFDLHKNVNECSRGQKKWQT